MGSGGVAMYILYIQYVHIHTYICTYVRNTVLGSLHCPKEHTHTYTTAKLTLTALSQGAHTHTHTLQQN